MYYFGQVDITDSSVKICQNCVRNTTCGHWIGDIFVKYCIPLKKSVYSDTDASDCDKFESKFE